MNMIDVLNEVNKSGKNCSGCGACLNICPMNAISKGENKQGFFYPKVEADKCIGCGKCTKVCPVLNPYEGNVEEPIAYSMRAEDEIRKESSSGGIFTLLANYILDRDGIICGAEMDKDFSVAHVCVDSKEKLSKLKKSKYVQSDTGYIYREIEEHLKNGKRVLFTGCPCQVAAARNYFKNNADNLFLVDIFCHGVPSNKMLKDYINENFSLDKISEVQFRNKEKGWRCDHIWTVDKYGTCKGYSWATSAFVTGFLNNIALREGCDNCQFCGHQRQGDLSIGDFWRVAEWDQKQDDGKGTSAVLINSEKGRQLFDAIKDHCLDYKEAPLKAVADYNRLNRVYRPHHMKKRFLELYPEKKGFTDAVWQTKRSQYDIGLVSTYLYRNYGSQLTQYALFKVLSEIGHSVLMIERPMSSEIKPNKSDLLFKNNPYPNYALSKIYSSLQEMHELNNICGTFVTGSDQIFNNNAYLLYDKFMVQNFVDDSHRKIAFAASFGHDHIWGSEFDRAEESYYLKKFDYFSVREDTAVDLCRNEFGIKSDLVLDPVFLCGVDVYDELIEKAGVKVPEGDYLFVYLINATKDRLKTVSQIAKERRLDIYAVVGFEEDKEKISEEDAEKYNIHVLKDLSIEEWLAYIRNSSFVAIDSYHGTCFSIIFKKEFLTYINVAGGETRYTSLFKLLDLEERGIYSSNQLSSALEGMEKIDYQMVDKKLTFLINQSIKWLENALNDKEKKSLSSEDILAKKLESIENKLKEISNQNLYLTSIVNSQKYQLQAYRNRERELSAYYNDSVFEYIKRINSFSEYLESIAFIDCTSIISVKDIQGYNLNEGMINSLKILGVKDIEKLLNHQYHSLIVVISNGKIVYSHVGNNELLRYEGVLNGKNLRVESATLNAGNRSIINIDGTEYSQQGRGFNIVVMDNQLNKVIDSVAFDTHSKNINCNR